MVWELPKTGAEFMRSMEAFARKTEGEFARIWKAMPLTPQNFGMPGGDPFTFGIPGGGSSGSATVELVTLGGVFYRGQTISGTLVSTGGPVTVDGTLSNVTGYFFANWVVPCLKVGDDYVPTQSGSFYETGTLSSALADGGTATLTLGSGDSITVTGTFGSVDSGNKVGASWSDRTLSWHVGDAEC
jgi:hypothetical protein